MNQKIYIWNEKRKTEIYIVRKILTIHKMIDISFGTQSKAQSMNKIKYTTKKKQEIKLNKMQNKCGKNQYYCEKFICVVKIHMYMNTRYMEDNFILLIFLYRFMFSIKVIFLYTFYAIWNCWLLIISTIKLVLLFETYFQFQYFCSPCSHFLFFSLCFFLLNNNQTMNENGKLTEHNNNFSFNSYSLFFFSLSLTHFYWFEGFFWNVTNLIFLMFVQYCYECIRLIIVFIYECVCVCLYIPKC